MAGAPVKPKALAGPATIRAVLALILAVVFLVAIVGPVAVICLMHFGGASSERRRRSRAQQLHDLAVQRRDAGTVPDLDPAQFHERDARLDQLSARFPRGQQLPAEQRDLYHLLTLDELDELIGL